MRRNSTGCVIDPYMISLNWNYAHFGITCSLVGLIWLVQIVVYPLMNRVGETSFIVWHARYTTSMSYCVGPMMLAELATAAWLLCTGKRDAAFLTSLGLLAIIWLSTAFIQVPMHHQLSQGFDQVAHEKLITSNWIRTSAWTLRALCLFFCL